MRLAALALFAAASVASAADPALFIVPLRIHLLRASAGSDAGTTLTPRDLRRIAGKVNRVWAQAGVRFETERIVEEPAAGDGNTTVADVASLIPPASFEPRAFNAYFIHRMSVNGILVAHGRLPAVFVKETATLKETPGGIDEPLPRVLSHELGHALGLSHAADELQLMASGTTGTRIDELERQLVRKNAATVPWIVKTAGDR